tara:strand:+ start:18528 stop:19673 length:1146 start_codon:yes stop_codon:yes gene_type:complete
MDLAKLKRLCVLSGAWTFMGVVVLFLMAGCAPSLRPTGEPSASLSFIAGDHNIQIDTPQAEPMFFRTIDGTLLALQRWLPGTPTSATRSGENAVVVPAGRSLLHAPRAVILGLHGFGDYANGFAEAGAQLAQHGIAVYAYDQRGFGRSPTRGFWPGMNSLVQDASDALLVLRGLYPDTPVYLTGVSMGAAVAIITAASRPQLMDGVILVSPAVWDRAEMPWYQTVPLAVLSHTLPWLPVTGRGLEIWPSDNIAMLRRLGRDPNMLSSVRVDMVTGIADLMDRARSRAGDLHLPMLVMTGQKDQVIPPVVMASFVNDLPERAKPVPKGGKGKRSATICVYEQGYHMLLRDLNGPHVIDDLAAWVAGKVPLENTACRETGIAF